LQPVCQFNSGKILKNLLGVYLFFVIFPIVQINGQATSGKPVAIIGDVHVRDKDGTNDTFRHFRDQFVANDYPLVIFAGDMVESGRKKEEWQRFFSIMSPFQGDIYPVVGNHDVIDKKYNGQKVIESYFKNIPADHYSFDREGIAFIVLNTQRLHFFSEQMTFLETALQRYHGRMPIVVLFHKPLYSMDMRSMNYAIPRLTLTRLFKDYGVDLVVSGHRHYYERLKPIGGVRFVIAGAGNHANAPGEKPMFSEKLVFKQHYLVIQRTGDALKCTAIGINETIIDAFDVSWKANDKRGESLNALAFVNMMGVYLENDIRTLMAPWIIPKNPKH
jgi:predicted phosphodiesterase